MSIFGEVPQGAIPRTRGPSFHEGKYMPIGSKVVKYPVLSLKAGRRK